VIEWSRVDERMIDESLVVRGDVGSCRGGNSGCYRS
jgi:hypothetical protein